MEGICLDEIQMYQMFLLNLSALMYETHYGSEFMGSKENKEHFTWCVETLCGKYREVGYNINALEIGIIYYKYFEKYFYKVSPRTEIALEKVNNLLLSIMQVNGTNIELKKRMKKAWT